MEKNESEVTGRRGYGGRGGRGVWGYSLYTRDDWEFPASRGRPITKSQVVKR